MSSKPAIPDRWIPYKACGKIIEGTRFICFKVPLRKHVQENNPDIKEIWDIPALLAKISNVGAVIDLTNTARYYNPQELKDAGILHKKIFMPGRIIPPENTVQEFMNAVDEFLGKDCESLVGVHCTHGLNRTGYMVCRYMRDRLGIPAKTAIKRFEKARGYQIERENYLADLMGNEPPPPDVGRDTELKPLKEEKYKKNSMTYRSPLGYDDEENDQNGRRYDTRRFGGRSNYKYTRDRGRNYSDRRSRQRSRSPHKNNDESDTNKSYDYRYDY
ncbi:hypothetical protein K1T71_001174 [Dendrolimus kikuchii]|uniref:Uncharacterized protein n=1 Tax=Dendrolimus kikuchii TaxID=765133 RepID=A0ACC1DGV5_9NEOP|nr:hypothetical protein K1T71_001174 [Dendrolimus kikuchii]